HMSSHCCIRSLPIRSAISLAPFRTPLPSFLFSMTLPPPRSTLFPTRRSSDLDTKFLEAKIATARFYADHVLVQAPALRNTVVNGAAGVMALSEDQFLAA